MVVGIIGGTGPEGRGLGLRFALAGEAVLIGSRDPQRAREAAGLLGRHLPTTAGRVEGVANRDAARADMVVLAVPYVAQAEILAQLRISLIGKVTVNVIAPVEIVNGRARAVRPTAGSASEEAAALVPGARWVAGFHTLPARDLLKPDLHLDTDALICGNDPAAKHTVMALAAKIPGLRAVDAGSLESARYLEAASALLININRIYKAHASIRIHGI